MSQDNQKKRKADEVDSKEHFEKAKEIEIALDSIDDDFDQGSDNNAIRTFRRMAKLLLKLLRQEEASADWARLCKCNHEYLEEKKAYAEEFSTEDEEEPDPDGEPAAEASNGVAL